MLINFIFQLDLNHLWQLNHKLFSLFSKGW